MTKIVFIIGAGRSGTHLLANTIVKNINSVYLNEINDFWKKSFPFLRTDLIPEKYAEKTKGKRIRNKFLKRGDSSKIIIEKTAANSIRIPFLKALFPEAYFIHIIRDGREVAISASKKYYGDIRKVTQKNSDELKYIYRIKHLTQIAIRKSFLIFHPIYLLSNIRRFYFMVLKELKIVKYSPWGVRYPGYSYIFKHESALTTAAEQWQYTILKIMNYFSNRKEKYLEIRYEDILSKPEQEINKALEFIQEKPLQENIVHDIIVTDARISYDNLTKVEQNQLNNAIGFTLNSLGYNITNKK